MIPISDWRKFFSYAIIIFVMLASSGANPLVTSKPFLIGGWVVFTGVYFYFENLIKPKFGVLLGIFAAILVYYYVQNGDLNPITYIGLFINILLAYYSRDLAKEHFYDYFVNVIFVFACISLGWKAASSIGLAPSFTRLRLCIITATQVLCGNQALTSRC
jgi:hypothetical protein